eukprot:UN01230
MLNDPQFRKKTQWKIVNIMRAERINKEFEVGKDKLPVGSRNMEAFVNGLNISAQFIDCIPVSIIWKTNFKKLCKKVSKRKYNIEKAAVNISEYDLKRFCEQSWNNGGVCPVVVIKGGKHWIEMKKFVRIFDDIDGSQQWIGISLRYHQRNKKWKIECMDYDGGRVFYQYRLVGLNNDNYCYSYNDLIQLVNTKLNIY